MAKKPKKAPPDQRKKPIPTGRRGGKKKELHEFSDKLTVSCPRKHHLIGEVRPDKFAKNLTAGLPGKIKFDKDQRRKVGEEMKCKVCGSAYVVDGNVHTTEGWYPETPRIEPVPYK